MNNKVMVGEHQPDKGLSRDPSILHTLFIPTFSSWLSMVFGVFSRKMYGNNAPFRPHGFSYGFPPSTWPPLDQAFLREHEERRRKVFFYAFNELCRPLRKDPNSSVLVGKINYPKDLGPSNRRVWTCIAGLGSSK